MRDWKENYFNSSTFGDLRFYYSGIREKSINHHYGPRVANHYLLNYIYEGTANFWCQGKMSEVTAGTFYVMFPNCDMHYQTKKDTEWSIQWIVVDGTQVESFLVELGITPSNPFLKVENTARLKEIFDHIFENTKVESFRNKMLCFSYLYQMFALLLEQKKVNGRNPLTVEAEVYIRQHLCDKISVVNIADHVHLSSSYFVRLFKAELGETPLHYINQKRIEKGKYLLEHTQFSVSEISVETGFDDALYFSRVFKKYVGLSPLAYRRQLSR